MPATEIPMVPVQSSALAAFGYDDDSQTLALLFKGQERPHLYPGVPPKVAMDLADAKSIGRFVATQITPNYVGHQDPEPEPEAVTVLTTETDLPRYAETPPEPARKNWPFMAGAAHL